MSLLSLFALAITSIASAGEIKGTAAYRERILLPADAVVTIRLEDVSLADAPSKLVSELSFVSGGKQVPIPFSLPYMDGAIKSGRRYNVRAMIHIGGKLTYTSANAYMVISNGKKSATILLTRVQEAAPSIGGVTWRLEELNGQPAQPGQKGAPTIKFDVKSNGINGYTGVNGFSASYNLKGTALTIQPGAQTLIAGPVNLMSQEDGLRKALSATTAYRLQDGKLELLNGEEVIARFVKG